MKFKRLCLFLLIALIFSGCDSNNIKFNPIDNGTLTLIVGDTRTLTLSGTPIGPVTWSSSEPNVVSVTNNGTVTAVGITDGGNNRYISGYATGSATITASGDNGFSETFIVNTTTEAQEDIMTLPPLKDQFSNYFLIGNIVGNLNNEITETDTNVVISNPQLLRHYNVLTAENHMKPSYIVSGRNGTTFTYNWNNSDRFVNAAHNSGFKVVGHTLLWHSQNGNAINGVANLSKDTALEAMRNYIAGVVSRYKGKIYSWDVLNEAFPDNVAVNANWRNVMRTGGNNSGNPWYTAIGADFVYEGFLAARLADPDAILYYNDYNTDILGKATMIRDMVRDVNQRYKDEHSNSVHSNNGSRLLIEGIGMQEHHNTGITAASIRVALNLFKPLGVRISVSELDVLGQTWGQFSSIGQSPNWQDRSTVTNQGIITQANLYGQYMKLYIEFSDIIERVTLWGVTDERSWRSAGLPLLFNPQGKAKPAYYRFIGALD